MKPLEQVGVMALLVLFQKNLGEMIFIFRRIYFLILKWVIYNHRQNIWNKIKKIKQYWAETENFGNCFCVIFDCYYESFISGEKTE